MNIFLLLTIAMLMIILMLRRHIPIGPVCSPAVFLSG